MLVENSQKLTYYLHSKCNWEFPLLLPRSVLNVAVVWVKTQGRKTLAVPVEFYPAGFAVSGSLNVKMEFYWADDHWCYSSSSVVTDFVHGIDCSAICVDCFQAGDHRDHDYGTFAHQICTLSFLPIILTNYSSQKKVIHWFWESDEPYFVVIQHIVFVLFGWNWYSIDLITLHVLLEFLSAIIYMYIHVCLNSVSKTLWLECSHVSQWVWRVLWLWGQRCLEDIRVSTTLMVEH
jgi:hypothetical protein